MINYTFYRFYAENIGVLQKNTSKLHNNSTVFGLMLSFSFPLLYLEFVPDRRLNMQQKMF